MGIVPTEMELILEQTQQGISHEVSRQSVKVKELQERLQVLKVTSAQGGKDYKMAERDYAWLKISRCSKSHPIQAKEQAQDQKSMITTTNSQGND
nr:hypothetical protein [Tanacetum cinerariifolium]